MLNRRTKTSFYISLMLMVMIIFVAKVVFAFTDMSMENLVNEIQRLGARKDTTSLQVILNNLSKMDIKKHTQADMLRFLKDLIAQNKVPVYILNGGQYSYVENNNILYLKGTNIHLRSEPNTNAKIITTLNTDTTAYLRYLGEWKSSKGERWVLVANELNTTSEKLGWIFGKYTVFVSNSTIQKLINQIKNYLTSTKNINNDTKAPPKKKSPSHRSCGGDIAILLIPLAILVKHIFIDDSSSETENSSANDLSEEKYPCCPEYQRNFCRGCNSLSYDHPYSDFSYRKCNYFDSYVKPDYSPQYNAENLQSFEDECCPFYKKISCGYCPKFDEEYSICREFNIHVSPDDTPQYNTRYR